MSIGSRTVNSERVMQDTMRIIKIRSSIKGLHHYYLPESAINLKESKPFFLGNRDGFTGITLNSIDFDKQPARISVTTRRAPLNMTDLVYCEYNNKQNFPVKSIKSECERPRVLITNVDKVKFNYFGWSSLNALYEGVAASSNGLSNKKVWAETWDATTLGLLPQYIKITFTYGEKVLPYQPQQLWFHIADADPLQFNVNSSNNEE